MNAESGTMKLLKRVLIACGLGFLGVCGLAVLSVAGLIYGLSRVTIVIPPPPPRILPETTVVRSEESSQFLVREPTKEVRQPTKEKSSSNHRYQESWAEKVQEKLTGTEIVHRKDGTTYTRKAAQPRK